MIYFTSDTHFGDKRLELYHRDLVFNTHNLIDTYIKVRWNNIVRRDDTVYHLGDVAMDEKSLGILNDLNGKKILILGNYDKEFYRKGLLDPYFETILHSSMIQLGDYSINLVHEPTSAQENIFNLVGHIHGLWQVQKNMINVSTDAWHFSPVSEELILWKINAIEKYYDQNVFIGSRWENFKHHLTIKEKRIIRRHLNEWYESMREDDEGKNEI